MKSRNSYLRLRQPDVMNCRFLLITAFLFFIFILPFRANSQDISFPEYEIKATFLYNFIKFIEWPGTNLSFYYICILGEDPFGKAIEKIQGKTVASYPIKIKYIKAISEFQKSQNCHILFISATEKDQLADILFKVGHLPILTVTDQKDAAKQGAMINLIKVEDKVRFEINNRSASKTGIKISSKLLRLATDVIQ